MVFEHGSSCNECTIRKTTIFSSLSNTELSTINSIIQTIHYRKKESVFLENSPMTDIYLVKNGIVKVYKSVQDGRQQILRLCGLGDILGLDAVFSEHYYTTAKAVVDSTVCKISKKDFLDFIYSNQKLAVKLLQATSKELAFSQTQIFNLGTRTAKERIADFLLYVYNSQCSCDANTRKINLPISRQEISELLGIKQETAVRILTQLRVANLIQIKGREITLLNPSALGKIALHE